MAERNYPASEVSGGGWEELTCIRGQWWPRGDTPSPRSGVAAERSYPASKVSGSWEETPRARGQGQRPRGATPRLRPVAARRRHPEPEARGGSWEEPPKELAEQAQEGLEELSHVEGQERWQ